MNCALCGRPAILTSSTATYRRGSRTVEIKTKPWRCPWDCEDPDGEKPFTWYVPSQLKENDEEARRVWQATYGELMPPSGFKVKK